MKYGLKFEEIKPEDYVFGSVGSVPMQVLQEDGDWRPYLPKAEYQNLNGIEPYACAIFTLLNCVEILIKRKYGIEKNYSDRFLATVVGTRGEGTTPQQACEFLRKVGVVPEEIYSFDVSTEDEFFKPLSPKLYELAREFNAEWDFKHDYVPTNHTAISSALECSPLLISVSAWYRGENGRYYRPEGMQDNHATTLVAESPEAWMRVFDSYADGEDDPYFKDVEWSAVPQVVKRFWVERKEKIIKRSFWDWLRGLFK